MTTTFSKNDRVAWLILINSALHVTVPNDQYGHFIYAKVFGGFEKIRPSVQTFLLHKILYFKIFLEYSQLSFL